MCYIVEGIIIKFLPIDRIMHLTPTSSLCWQPCSPSPLCSQSISRASFPMHATRSSTMGPVPWPNMAKGKSIAPVCIIENKSMTVYYDKLNFAGTYMRISMCIMTLLEQKLISILLAFVRKPQLSTYDRCIFNSKSIVTDCAPGVIVTKLHSSFGEITTPHQSKVPQCLTNSYTHTWHNINSTVYIYTQYYQFLV